MVLAPLVPGLQDAVPQRAQELQAVLLARWAPDGVRPELPLRVPGPWGLQEQRVPPEELTGLQRVHSPGELVTGLWPSVWAVN